MTSFARDALLCSLLTVLVVLPGCGDEGAEAPPQSPRIVTEAVPYRHDGVALEGYLAYDANRKDKRPGVLVIHEWWGLAEHPKERARRLAELGYVAFCPDMYGKGKLTDDPEQAKAWSGAFYQDPLKHGRARIRAGYDVLAENEHVDPTRIAAIGFCFGGTVALELAWSGADVKAVVCFHGTLRLPEEADVPGVKAKVLVCNGAADVWVGPDKIQAFGAGLDEAGIPYEIENYEGAVHAFTNPGADARGMDNVKYDKKADEQSWEAMMALLSERLGS